MANMSFLPEDYLEKRIQRRTNIISLLLFAVVMAGVVGAYYVTDRQRSEVRAQQAKVNRQYEEAAELIEQRDRLEERKFQIMHKAAITSSLRERVHRSVILAELINNMPGSLALLSFDLDTRLVKATRPPGGSLMDDAKRAANAAAKNGGAAPQPENDIQQFDVTIQLEGVAPTDVQVAQFMTALSRSRLFTDLNLAYSEEIAVEDRKMRKFRVDLRINPDLDLQKFEPLMVKRDLERNPMDDSIVTVGPGGKIESNTKNTMGPPPDHADKAAVPVADKH